MKRKAWSWLLVLTMALSLLPVSALAAGDETEVTSITASGGSLASGSYTLSDNITLSAANLTIPAGNTVTIDLNGHTLTGNGTGSVITVYGTLTLNDTAATKQAALSSATAGVVSNEDGSWTVTYIIYDENDNSSYSTYTAGAITGGVGGNDCGGGIHVAGNGTVTMNGGIITNCKVSESQQYALGGGIYLAKNSSFTMSDGAISGNTAKSSVSSNGQGSGGGVYVAPNSTFSMTGGVFSSNKAEGANANGGAVFSQGTFTAENAVFSGNTSAHWTGGIVGKVTLKNCVLVDNQTGTVDGSYGGALSGGGNIEACIISHNSAQGEGGGVYLNEDTEIKTSYIQYNTAGSGGGGISVAAKSSNNGKTIKINASYVRNNTAGTENADKSGGGGIKLGNNNVMTLTDTEVSQNSALGSEVYGGGVYNDNGELTIEGDTKIVENVNKGSTKSLGGGVFTGRNTIVTGGEIQKNTAKQGGGIYVADQKFSMSGGSITHNHAEESGGGIYVYAANPAFRGSVVVKDNTVGESEAVDNLTFTNTNTTYKACLSGALTDGAEIGIQVTNSKNSGRELIVAQSDSTYSITASDLSHFVYDGDGYALYFDTSTNSIKMGTAVTVTFNANTGDNSATATQQVPSDQNAALNANTFTRTGYTFTGWSTQQSGGETAYADKANINISTDTTLYAQWSSITSLSLSADQSSVTYGTKITLTADPAMEGWTYQWYKVDGTTETVVENESSKTLTLENVSDSGSYKVKITLDDKTEAISSEAVSVTIAKAGQSAPSVLELESVSRTSITLKAVEGNSASNAAAQYRINGGEWQSNPTFDNLTAGTSYTIEAYYPGNENYEDSPVATATFTTTSSGSPSGSSTYAVSVGSTEDGTVSVSPRSASRGTTVTITVSPDSGYELEALTVTDKNGDTVKLTKKSETQYTFTMPASKVTVDAAFAEIRTEPSINFTDVPADAYYADAVAWAVENGITEGTSATTFSPDASCTRAQMVTFLWRAAGSPKAAGSNPFEDVTSTSYYYDAVLWAVEQGITVGTSATTFSPDAVVTRGQTVTFLYRYAGSPAVSGSNPFADVDSSAYYANAVQWAVSNGITNGTGNNQFSPEADCTRAQIVTFLYRSSK